MQHYARSSTSPSLWTSEVGLTAFILYNCSLTRKLMEWLRVCLSFGDCISSAKILWMSWEAVQGPADLLAPTKRQTCTSHPQQRSSPLLACALRMMPRMKEILNDEALSIAEPSINLVLPAILPWDTWKVCPRPFSSKFRLIRLRKSWCRRLGTHTEQKQWLQLLMCLWKLDHCHAVSSCWNRSQCSSGSWPGPSWAAIAPPWALRRWRSMCSLFPDWVAPRLPQPPPYLPFTSPPSWKSLPISCASLCC